jgi:phosphonate transport system substrate-binding protein
MRSGMHSGEGRAAGSVLLLLPPVKDVEAARAAALPIAKRLGEALARLVTIDVATSYQALGDAVLSGEALAAWAPPIVCARIEIAGGRVVLRAERSGAASYRAALVMRTGELFDVDRARDLRAAWVDEDSAGGYLLARSYLAARHVDAWSGFQAAHFFGSYRAALDAVAAGQADICSVFAAPASGTARSAIDELAPELKPQLHVVAYAGETQYDGVATGPRGDEALVALLTQALSSLDESGSGKSELAAVLHADRLVPEQRKGLTSAALRDLLLHG